MYRLTLDERNILFVKGMLSCELLPKNSGIILPDHSQEDPHPGMPIEFMLERLDTVRSLGTLTGH